MIKVLVINSDSHVWNLGEVVQAITFAKSTSQDLELDLNNEGPDFETLQLVKYISDWDSRTTVVTRNAVQSPVGNIQFKTTRANHTVDATRRELQKITVNKNIEKPFGCFVGRSNVHRLYLSSYLYRRRLANQTFHYDSTVEFHKVNLGLDKLVETYTATSLSDAVWLLENSPVVTAEKVSYPMVLDQNFKFYKEYSNFLVEIVCESYYSGRTFFATEKTFRPMILETPFIVQGPQWHLHRLRDLGFQTFDRWWDEGYAEDPSAHQPYEIVKVIDSIAEKSIQELNTMYQEMQPILQHNKKRLMELTGEDFEIFENDRY